MLREGKTVSYVGFPGDGLALGDQGRVLSASESCCHVMWTTGARAGKVDLLSEEDVVPLSTGPRQATVEQALDDSLFLPHLSARAVYDGEGVDGVLSALSEGGLLGSLTAMAEEAAVRVVEGVRQDEGLTEVLSSLDGDEADAVVCRIAFLLLKDALGGDDG